MNVLEGKEKEEAERCFKEAVGFSRNSRCLKRPRGTVIVKDGKIIGRGWNAPASDHSCKECLRDKMKPKTFSIFNTEPCYSVHAEQRAIIDAFKSGHTNLSGAKMYFARSDKNGKYMPCDDGPSCTICSKLILESGLDSFIYETYEDGVVELSAKEFHDLSMQYVEGLSK